MTLDVGVLDDYGVPGANGPSRTKNLLSKVYYDPRGKGTVPSVFVGVRVEQTLILSYL